jgi:hypothetical protein
VMGAAATGALTSRFVTGFDQPPAGERFPARYWQAGDCGLSESDLSLAGDLESGDRELRTRLYPSRSRGKARLAGMDTDLPVQDRKVLLGSLELR